MGNGIQTNLSLLAADDPRAVLGQNAGQVNAARNAATADLQDVYFPAGCIRAEQARVREESEREASGLSGQAQEVANARKLSPDDVTRAVKTFVPPGNQHGDEFFLISSGGHSGQVFVMGVPSLLE